jgi:hypothetical protein
LFGVEGLADRYKEPASYHRNVHILNPHANGPAEGQWLKSRQDSPSLLSLYCKRKSKVSCFGNNYFRPRIFSATFPATRCHSLDIWPLL